MPDRASGERPLDRDVEEFRVAGKAMIDWIAGYLSGVQSFPVLPSVEYGQTEKAFASSASVEGKSFQKLLAEFESKILPGITHWNHPGFMAYFAITGSQAGILGELLSAALNVNGMLWKTSPSVTELEKLVLDWLREALGLPEGLFGIINDTASVNSFLALAAARERTGLNIRREGMTGRSLPQLRVYCSDQAHSSIEKGALALGIGAENVVKIPSDDRFQMKVEDLVEAIRADRKRGFLPMAISATVGTTSTAAIDPVPEIGEVAKREGIWLHVDAAYAGSAAIVPELREMWRGIEYADSIVTNPHKWLFTPVDCSVLYTRHPDVLRETFSLVPEYLTTSDPSETLNYMDYGIQLGRRFRALKLWMVLEHYGLERLRSVIRQQVGYAGRLAAELQKRNDVELIAPPSLSVVVFRKIAKNKAGAIDEGESERISTELLESMNRSGEIFVSHTRLRGRYGIRVAIGNGATQWRHVERILEFLA